MKSKEMVRTAAVAIRSVVLGTNLAALGLLKDPKRLVRLSGENVFLYRSYADVRGLPQRNVFDVLDSGGVETVRLGALRVAERWFHPVAASATDLLSLCLLCQIVNPRTVFEIGTLGGYTAYHMALNSGADSRIYTLDLPKAGNVESALGRTVVDQQFVDTASTLSAYCFSGTPEEGKISCLFGDSATFDYSPFHGQVDLFFIDGAHSYEYVKSDTLNALACCHRGSVIAWHDFGRMGVNGVSRWLVELSKRLTIYSVPGGSLAFAEVG